MIRIRHLRRNNSIGTETWQDAWLLTMQYDSRQRWMAMIAYDESPTARRSQEGMVLYAEPNLGNIRVVPPRTRIPLFDPPSQGSPKILPDAAKTPSAPV